MPKGIGYQQTGAGANIFNGYINYDSDRKNTLLQTKSNGKTEYITINAVGVQYMLKNNCLHYILL